MNKSIVARVLSMIRIFSGRLPDITGITIIPWMIRNFGQRGTGRPFSWFLLLADIFWTAAIVFGSLLAYIIFAAIFTDSKDGYTAFVFFALMFFFLLSLLLWRLFRFLAQKISGISPQR